MTSADSADSSVSALTDWVSITDPDGNRWLFDLTFLTSNWTCVYGTTCRGISDDPETGRLQGCCSHGVHLLDDDDRDQVAAAASRLQPEHWENHALVDTETDLFERNDEGELLTVVHDGACIFLNGPDAPTGPGCALHFGANDAGEAHHEWKPMACWQLPLRLEELVDSSGVTTWMLRSWNRSDWGEGGAAFDWWCTESHEAFVGTEPAWQSLRGEIVELIGEAPYTWLSNYLSTHDAAQAKPSSAVHPHETSVELDRR